MIRVHGGAKFYRGAPKAARTYLERDCARYDDYYLAEGDGLAIRLVAEAKSSDVEREVHIEGKHRHGRRGAPEDWVAGRPAERPVVHTLKRNSTTSPSAIT